MNGLTFLETLAAFGVAGFGAGLGLLVGAFIIRWVRRLVRDDNGRQ